MSANGEATTPGEKLQQGCRPEAPRSRSSLKMPPRKFASLSLEVEISAGSDIDSASRDLVMFADFLGLCVTAKFNDVLLMAHPGGDPEWLAANWWTQTKNKHRYKIAVSYRLDPTADSKVGVMPSDAHEGEVQPSKTESL